MSQTPREQIPRERVRVNLADYARCGFTDIGLARFGDG